MLSKGSAKKKSVDTVFTGTILVLLLQQHLQKKNKKTGSKQCILMNHVWQPFFWTHELPHQQKKSNHHLTIHHHLQQLHTFPANFLPFNLFFCFPKKSKKLFRLKEDKTWLPMFLKLIAWISLIVTRSKGRHLRFCRWIPSGGFRVGVFLGVVWPFFLYERPDVLLRDLWLFNAVFVWWCLYVLKHMSTSGVQMIYMESYGYNLFTFIPAIDCKDG